MPKPDEPDSRYYRQVAIITGAPLDPHNFGSARNADMVVLDHEDGTWTVWKDRYDPVDPKRMAWDNLPRHVKTEIWNCREADR